MRTSLTTNAQTKMLVEAAIAHPEIAGKIASAHHAKINRDQAKAAREAARPQDFWSHYDKAFDQMCVKHERLSGSRQYNKGFDVAFGIERSLETIASKTTPECPYETKFSAIDTIREIFALLDATGQIPHIVRQNTYDWGTRLIRVIETFSPEELDRLRNEGVQDKGPGSWIRLFEETVKIAKSYCVEKELQTNEAWDMLTAV